MAKLKRSMLRRVDQADDVRVKAYKELSMTKPRAPSTAFARERIYTSREIGLARQQQFRSPYYATRSFLIGLPGIT